MGTSASELPRIPAGEIVFIDANIFIYHFTGTSSQCSEFLERCEQGELVGVTGAHVLLEVLHRLMMIEAVSTGLLPARGVARRLRRRPEIVKRLRRYQEQTVAILEMGIEALPVSPELVERGWRYRREQGLLVNDSITCAQLEISGISALATADRDFSRVPGFDDLYTDRLRPKRLGETELIPQDRSPEGKV